MTPPGRARYSIERQLRGRLLLALLLVLMLMLLLINTLSQHLLQSYVLNRLAHDAEGLIAALEPANPPSKPARLHLETKRLPDLYQRAFSGHYYQIELPDRTLRSRSLWDLELPHPLPEQEGVLPQLQIQDQQLLGYSIRVQIHRQPVHIWVAEDIRPLEDQNRRFILSIIGFLLVAFALLWWLQGRTLRRSFRVFEQLRRRVQSLHQGEDSDSTFSPPQEIQPLSDEINRLLVQLGQRTERSRSALGNFAHELKRPLQQLRMQQEQLPEHQQQPLARSLDQIQYLLERELKRARIAGRCLPGQALQPDQDLPPLLQVMRRIYPDTDFCSQLDSSLQQGQPVTVDRDDALELLGNLLDNAAKFSRSRVILRLSLRTSAEGESLLSVCVEDDGPGVDAEALRQLTLRGTRLDESVAGHGLGLSICKSICDSYDGQLHFARSDAGGLKVTADLPLQSF